MFKTFEEMPVWQDAMDLAQEIFKLTESLPRKEDYGLTAQLRRAALSISANISEGFGRRGSKDKARFYYNARGSITETKNNLIYGKNVGYFNDEDVHPLFERVDEIWKQINCVINAILSDSKPQP